MNFQQKPNRNWKTKNQDLCTGTDDGIYRKHERRKYSNTKDKKSDDEMSGNEADIEHHETSQNIVVDIESFYNNGHSKSIKSSNYVYPVSYESISVDNKDPNYQQGLLFDESDTEKKLNSKIWIHERNRIKEVTRIMTLMMFMLFCVMLYCIFLTQQIAELQGYHHSNQHHRH